MTPDDATAFINESFDIPTFANVLANDTSVLRAYQKFSELIAKCVVVPIVMPFTSVSEQHLEDLELQFAQRTVLNPRRAAAANQRSISVFQKQWGVGGLSINTSSLPLFNDPQLKSSLHRTYKVVDPHVAVFTQLPVPETKIKSGGASYTFYGHLDYALGFIKTRDTRCLGRGSAALDVYDALSGVIEVKGPIEMEDIPQMTAQVLTMLMLTERKAFTGALTNGESWRFFTAYKQDDGFKIFMSKIFDTDGEGGIIIELPKDMILYPKSPMVDTNFDEKAPYQ